MCSFKIYGIWPQASKNARTYVNTLPQCSPASVGLAQARPNQNSINLILNLHVYGYRCALYSLQIGGREDILPFGGTGPSPSPHSDEGGVTSEGKPELVSTLNIGLLDQQWASHSPPLHPSTPPE